ncbi:MAG: hypothetical protein HDR20_08090 [Lachnospiraceae bacterium]|nr:hypothetical protein [Lachnospiraceae bacterium]
MKKQKLNYRFHNPNPADVTADYILKIFIEVNEKKVEQAIRSSAGELKIENSKECPV